MLAIACVAALASQRATSAATIVVEGQTDDPPGTCDLIEAIQNANDTSTGQPNADCAVGDPSGADAIALAVDVTLSTAFSEVNGLPPITSEIALDGSGRRVARSSGAGPFRIIEIAPSGHLTLTRVEITGARLNGWGGGIYNGGTLNLFDSTLSGNLVYSGLVYSGGGGGLYNAGTATIDRSTISGNLAHADGSYNGSPPIGKMTYGGGIANRGTLDVFNSTFSDNVVSSGNPFQTCTAQGAAIFNWDSGTVNASHVTFIDNRSEYVDSPGCPVAGAIWNDGTALVNGSLFACGSVPCGLPLGALCTSSDGGPEVLTDAGGNIAEDSSCSTTIASNLDPTKIDPSLAFHGGPTRTHALHAGSNAIDLNGSCGLATDQRFAARSDGACDAGAFEFVPLIFRDGFESEDPSRGERA